MFWIVLYYILKYGPWVTLATLLYTPNRRVQKSAFLGIAIITILTLSDFTTQSAFTVYFLLPYTYQLPARYLPTIPT